MRPNRTLALLGSLSLAFAALAFLALPRPAVSVWKGHSLLLMPLESSEAEALAVLSQLGWGCLSESTQPVRVSNFSPQGGRGGLETLGLAEAQARLGDRDPRRDPYLEGLSSWFRARQGNRDFRIVYLTGHPGPRAKAIMQAKLDASGIKAFFPEASSRESRDPLAFAALGLGLLGLLALSASSRRAFLLGGLLLPLLPLGLGGMDAALAALLLACLQVALSPAWEAFLENLLSLGLKSRGLRFFRARSRQFLAPALSILGFALWKPGLLPSILLGFLAGALGAAALLRLRRSLEGRRASFVPLPILGVPPSSERPQKSQRAAGILVVVSLGLSLLVRSLGNPGPQLPGDPSGLVVPQAQLESGPAMPGPGIAVSLMAGPGELPNLADWLAHRWRQESLFFSVLGREYLPFAPVDLPQAVPPISLVPDQAWAREAYRSLSGASVEGLLLGLGRFSRVSPRPILPGSVDFPGPLAPIEVILYIILMAPPMLGALFERMGGFHRRREQQQHHESL